jgi:hypothetical protein
MLVKPDRIIALRCKKIIPSIEDRLCMRKFKLFYSSHISTIQFMRKLRVVTAPPKLYHPHLLVFYILCAHSTDDEDYASIAYHGFIGERISQFSAFCTHWKKRDLFFSE